MAAGFVLGMSPTQTEAGGFYNLPPMAPPEKYGNLMISRASSQEQVLPVEFSHWTHRRGYTCEVCHTELEINMVLNSTEITHDAQDQGRYCGACHDGKTAFSHEDDCNKCHSQDTTRFRIAYSTYFGSKPFVPTDYGNQIDWVLAQQRGLVKPRRFLKEESLGMTLDRELELEAEVGGIPAAGFPHAAHLEWMGCNMCHPEVFNIQKKGTENLNMAEILKGNFCGACHLNVAFPLDDCKRCHPNMRSR